MKGFLHDFSDNGFSKYVHLGHMSKYVLKETTQILDEVQWSFSRMAEMCFFKGLKLVGVNQSKSVVFWTAH